MQNISLQQYLHNYALNMKKYEINKNLYNIKTTHNKITNFIMNNPSTIYPLTGIMYGGQNKIVSKELVDKMEKMSDILAFYKRIDMTDINAKSKTLEKSLDKLINEIESTNTNQLDNVTNPNEIVNNLDIIRTNAEKWSKGIKFNIQKNKINMPIDDSKTKLNIFVQVMNDLTQYLKNVSIEINNNNKLSSDRNAKLDIEIADHIKSLNASIYELGKTMDEISKINTTIFESFNYNINDGDINIIPSIKNLYRLIEVYAANTPFYMSMNNAYTKLQSGKIKDKDFVEQYNELIGTIDNANLPQKYFDGKFTKRITNNFLMNDEDIIIKTNELTKIIKNDNITLKEIYAPTFKKNNEILDSRSSSISSSSSIEHARTLTGGNNESDLSINLTLLTNKLNAYTILVEQYTKIVKIYNDLQIKLFQHTLFTTLILTNQLFTSDYVIYDYINKGTISFYNKIIKNIISKINKKNQSDEIMYLKKYHFVTLVKLSNFCDSIFEKIGVYDIINIEKCKNDVVNGFLLLNYFKSILESYREKYQNAITIYARINDVKTVINVNDIAAFNAHKMFISDYEKMEFGIREGTLLKNASTNADNTLMHIRKSTCGKLNSPDIATYKFTEVFDSIQFPMNGDISKYMTLDTQLSKGKGIAIMTYGYSGTGKTFTLFGSNDANKEGILQSTLDNINGLKSVKFRLFELYGYGLTYPHYWKDDKSSESRMNEISHEIYKYKVIQNSTTLLYESVEEVKARDISTYIDDHIGSHETYISIPESIVSNIFKNFDKFMTEIEGLRQGKNINGTTIEMKRRIRDTPNNIVSSRSVLVYDFILEIGNNHVPFLIIDLPGREEIVQTYISPFLENDHVKNILKNGLNAIPNQSTNNLIVEPTNFDDKILFMKTLLATMAINPIATPLFAYNEDKTSNIIFDFINKHDDRKKIFTEELNFQFEIDSTKYTKMSNETIVGNNVLGKYKLLEEIINPKGTRLSIYFNIDSDFKLGLNDVKLNGFGYSKTNTYQYHALVSIHIMNRLIIMNRFDIIFELYKKIVYVHLNKYLIEGVDKIENSNIINTFDELKRSNFKGELINSVEQKKEKLKEIIQYDYYLTPFEGIYINENIAGLIKYLGATMIVDEDDKKTFLNMQKKDMLQPEGLNFQYQQKITRMWLMKNGKDEKEIKTGTKEEGRSEKDIRDFFGLNDNSTQIFELFEERSNQLSYNYANMQKIYNILTTSYSSQKIFNFDRPLITDILDPYVKEINDYKVFYLFGNYIDEAVKNLKCTHQYSLLENTKDFISTIVKN